MSNTTNGNTAQQSTQDDDDVRDIGGGVTVTKRPGAGMMYECEVTGIGVVIPKDLTNPEEVMDTFSRVWYDLFPIKNHIPCNLFP